MPSAFFALYSSSVREQSRYAGHREQHGSAGHNRLLAALETAQMCSNLMPPSFLALDLRRYSAAALPAKCNICTKGRFRSHFSGLAHAFALGLFSNCQENHERHREDGGTCAGTFDLAYGFAVILLLLTAARDSPLASARLQSCAGTEQACRPVGTEQVCRRQQRVGSTGDGADMRQSHARSRRLSS